MQTVSRGSQGENNQKSIKKVKDRLSFQVSFSGDLFVSGLGLYFRGNGRYSWLGGGEVEGEAAVPGV